MRRARGLASAAVCLGFGCLRSKSQRGEVTPEGVRVTRGQGKLLSLTAWRRDFGDLHCPGNSEGRDLPGPNWPMGFVLRRESQVNQTDECGGRRGRAGSAGRQMAPPPHPWRGPRAPRPLRRPTVVQANASSWPHRSGRRRKPSGPADPGSESRAGKAWRAFRGELAGGVERRGPAWAGVGRGGQWALKPPAAH